MNDLKTEKSDILIIGIGNSGRNDDGLGWKFVDIASQTMRGYFDIEYRYQLQVEDAELVSKYNKVIFVDASQAATQNGFEIMQCKKAGHYFFSSHLQSPQFCLAMLI
jgi:Ni,Fe-hydrogenase maturation factor